MRDIFRERNRSEHPVREAKNAAAVMLIQNQERSLVSLAGLFEQFRLRIAVGHSSSGGKVNGSKHSPPLYLLPQPRLQDTGLSENFPQKGEAASGTQEIPIVETTSCGFPRGAF